MRFLLIFIFFFYFLQPSRSQSEYIIELRTQALTLLTDGNMPEALPVFEKIIKADSTDLYSYYEAGVCHTLLKRNLSLAVKYFLKAQGSDEFPLLNYYLGMAYMYQHELKQAIACFNKYNEQRIENNEKEGEDVGRLIEMCVSGMNLMNNPLKVVYTNLGNVVNSTMNELHPYVPEDESYIIFSSNKRYDPVYKGYDENVYVSYSEKTGWTFPAAVKSVSTFDDEYPAFISHNDKFIGICTHQEGSFSEIQFWKKKGRSIRVDEMNPLHAITMSKKWIDGVALDEEMNIMIVSARYDKTQGGSDLYMLKKLPDGTWSKPRNLGPDINTAYDEINPQLSSDGSTLYFASKGHNSMGGFDLFVSNVNDITGEWYKPRNLGYPVNTTSDNINISFNARKKYAYVSTYRSDGFGGMDLYRINFLDVDDPCSVITGYVGVKDSAGVRQWVGNPYELNITVYDNKDNVYGSYVYNSYLKRFVTILPPGNYQLVIECPGYETYKEKIEILERNLFVPEMDREYILTPEKNKR